MIRIIIADDHTVVRKGLKQILVERYPDALIEEAADAESLLQKIMVQEWDLVISDLSMPGRSGLDALQQIKQSHPGLPVLILSVHSEEQYALRVLKAGASGYLNKDSAPDELIDAVQRVLLGRKYITPSIAEKLANSLGQDTNKPLHEHLSNREFDILKQIASGRSLSEIAEHLSISINTVSTYRTRLMAKMGLHTNADLTFYCIENNLL